MARRKACDWHPPARASQRRGKSRPDALRGYFWDRCSDRRDREEAPLIPRLIKIWCSSVIRQEKEQPGSLRLGGFSIRCKEELILSSLFVCFEAGSNGLGEGCPNEWPREKMVAMIGDRVPHGWASYPSRRRRGEEFQTGRWLRSHQKAQRGRNWRIAVRKVEKDS